MEEDGHVALGKTRIASAKGLRNADGITSNAISNYGKISYKNYPFPYGADATTRRHCCEKLSALNTAKHKTHADESASNAAEPPATTT